LPEFIKCAAERVAQDLGANVLFVCYLNPSLS